MLSSLCIYHIEDNEADRKLLAYALNAQGVEFELHQASDGESAVEVLRGGFQGERCSPSLIILDLNLPKRDGLQVLSQIRADPQMKMARVVVLTSSDSPDDVERARALGVTEYLRKPMGFDEFVQMGKHLVNLASGSEGAGFPPQSKGTAN